MQPLKHKISLPFDTRSLISRSQHSISFQFSRHCCSIVAAIKVRSYNKNKRYGLGSREFKEFSPIGFNTF